MSERLKPESEITRRLKSNWRCLAAIAIVSISFLDINMIAARNACVVNVSVQSKLDPNQPDRILIKGPENKDYLGKLRPLRAKVITVSGAIPEETVTFLTGMDGVGEYPYTPTDGDDLALYTTTGIFRRPIDSSWFNFFYPAKPSSLPITVATASTDQSLNLPCLSDPTTEGYTIVATSTKINTP